MPSKPYGFSISKKDGVSIIILLLLACLLFNQVLIHPSWVISPVYDIMPSYGSWKFFTHESFAQFGQLPFWYNIEFSGTPFLGNLSVSMFFYPFNMLFLIFPPDSVFGFMFLAHVFLAGAGMYILLKYNRVTRFGALVGAISFMFSTHLVSKIIQGALTNVSTIAWVPWVFLFFEVMIRNRKVQYAPLLGVALGLQFHASMVQVFFYSCFALSMYFLFTLYYDYADKKDVRRLMKPVLLFILAFLVCIMLSAIALFPALELAKYSTRNIGKSYEFSTIASLKPQNLIMLFMPNFFGSPPQNTDWTGGLYWEISMYIGLLSLVLALISVVSRRDKSTIPFIFLAIFGILFALGKYTPFFAIFYNYVPGFNLFRTPSTFLFITVFSLAMLAGNGADILFSRLNHSSAKFFSKYMKILSVLGALAMLSLPIIYVAKPMILEKGMSMLQTTGILESKAAKPIDFYVTHINLIFDQIIGSVARLGLLLLSAALIVFLRLKPKINKIIPKLILLILIVIDLITCGLPFIHMMNPDDIYFNTDLIRFLENDTTRYRVLDIPSYIPMHIAARHNIQLVGGYDPLILHYYVDVANLAANYTGYQATELPMQIDPNFTIDRIVGTDILDLLNVKYVISTQKSDLEGYRLVYENLSYTYPSPYGGKDFTNVTAPLYIYKNEHPLPRAYVIGATKTIENRSGILQELASPDFSPVKYVILEKELPSGPLNTSISEEVQITYYSPNRIDIDVFVDRPMVLVLSEVWYPAWKAYDNGKEKEIYRADYTLRGIYLEKGEHKVEFVYDSASYDTGKVITCLAILALMAYFIVYVVTHNRMKREKR